MCGIAGIVSPNIQSLGESLESMKKAIAHRGPDGHGTKVVGASGFVHTRLSIVDITSGAQPMVSAGGRYVITFNGEIYGYKRLRGQLDYPFRTNSDTEVILALYEKYGSGMLRLLRGMYSFAIWDTEKQTLFCARDPFGEKPFFYAIGGDGEFIFGSETRAVIASGLVRDDIDDGAVSHYLRKLYVHPSSSIYRNIKPLPAGHFLTFRSGAISVTRFWDFPSGDADSDPLQARDQLVSHLERAVEDQLVADVPVGAFLSGGLDSSTVVSVAAPKATSLMTLSYRYPGDLDEGEFARAVASRYSTAHIEMYEERHNLSELMMRMANVYDEPFADSSSIPTYLICEQARRHCKVVLTGDGADELFGGYVSRYRPLLHLADGKRKSNVVQAANYLMAKAMNAVVPTDSRRHYQSGMRFAMRGLSVSEGLQEIYQFFNRDELRRHGMYHPAPDDHIGGADGTVNDAMRADFVNYMPGDILVKTDRASMANGIELRAPFLDRDLVEFALRLPASLKIDLRRDKKILRDAFEPQWPAIVRARGKQGFGAPVKSWLQEPQVAGLKEQYLSRSSKICSYVEPSLVSRYRAGYCYKTWTLLVLALWLERDATC